MIIGVIFVFLIGVMIFGIHIEEHWLSFLSIIGMVFCLLCWAYQEDKEWEKFAIEYNCKVIRREKGHHSHGTAVVGGKVGFGSSYTADKTTYICDDGVEYVR